MNKEAKKAEREVLKMAEKTETRKTRETYRFLEVWVFGGGEFQEWVAPLFPKHFKVRYFSNQKRPLELLNEGGGPALILVNADSSGWEIIDAVKRSCAVQFLVVKDLPCIERHDIWTASLLRKGEKVVTPEELPDLLQVICL